MTTRTPSEVFTPRAAQVNDDMYVKRQLLEERLIDAFGSNKYLVIHGESGNGKTWLYKSVFARNDIHFDVVNLSQSVASGSLESAFEQKLGEIGGFQVVSQETNTGAGAKPFGIGLEHQMRTSRQFSQRGAFSRLLERVASRAEGKRAALILDNFETIVENDIILKQLGALIISADEESIAAHNVQVVIVGVPGNLKQTITRIANATPVANRLTELPEVARMNDEEASGLMRRGFIDFLDLKIDASIEQTIYTDISWKTDRIAQHIQELCLLVAQNARRNLSIIDQNVVDKASNTWISDSLSTDWGVIELAMNDRATRVGRKNQVLFAMGECRTEDFKYSDIETLVRSGFDVGAESLNVSRILTEFSQANNPIIRRTPKADAWRFTSPKYKMAIRTKLVKTKEHRVEIKAGF